MKTTVLRKIIILGDITWTSMILGFMYGHLSSMISALQKHDDVILSEHEISVIASLTTMNAIIGFGLAAVVTEKTGVKRSFSIFSLLILTSFMILYYARSMFMFILSRVTTGISLGSLVGLYTCTTAEYTTQEARGIFLNLITTAAPGVGTTLGHILCFNFHWRTVALIGALFSTAAVVMPFFWVESPHWLAARGRFDECEISFRKIHESTTESERELEILLKMEKSKFNRARKANATPALKRLKVAFGKKYFWELLLLCATMFLFLSAAGKGLFGTLITVILEDITGTSDVLLFTLSVDCAVTLGSLLSCVLIHKTSMRNLLFSTGCICIAILIILSASLYFKIDSVYFKWINLLLLASYFILFYAGPHPTIEGLSGEIFPSDIKLFCLTISATFMMILFTLSIYLLPPTVSLIGYSGQFLVMAALMSISLVFVWFRLPETKGKTLQEIEVYFKTKQFDLDKILNDEQINTLM